MFTNSINYILCNWSLLICCMLAHTRAHHGAHALLGRCYAKALSVYM